MMLAYPMPAYDGGYKCRYYPVPKSSILFRDKVYPVCTGCNRRYLPQLGCLWCTKYGLKTNKLA